MKINDTIYKWVGNVDAVLTSDEHGSLWMIRCTPDQKFRVVSRTVHPSGAPCMLGEFVSGQEDGRRFFFEPKAHLHWDRIAEKLTD